MYLLDTNVVSELRKPKGTKKGSIDKNVARWAHGEEVADLYLSTISILELETGILIVDRRDRAQGKLLRKWLEEHVLPTFAKRILPVDLKVARACAGLHVPDRMEQRDAMIAATAIVHHMTLVTRNLKDFKHAGISLLNPWDPLP